jgi:transcriptional regulator NrdR family protein
MSALCQVCGLIGSRVLETRNHESILGVVLRRRECPTGHRWTTWEVSEAFLGAVGLHKSRELLRAQSRGYQLREQALERRNHVLTLVARGQTTAQIARHVGVTEARVRQLKKNI